MDNETLLLTLRDQLIEWNEIDVVPSANTLRALIWALASDEDAKKNFLDLVAREEKEIEDMRSCESDFEDRAARDSDAEHFVAWGWEKGADCDGGK